MIDGLIKWLTKPEIKSNKKIRLRSIPKTEKEWFDLMESKDNEPNDPESQVYHFLDLDIEVSWLVSFSENEKHHEPIHESKKTNGKYVRDGHIFRTWKKHTEIIEACKQLVNDTIDWQFQEEIINEKKKSILSESLKVVDLVEQASIVLLQYLLETGIPEDLTIGEAIISLTWQTKVWLPKNQNISCTIIDESKLNFLIKDCTDARTFARRERYLLRFILTYFEGHQPQYTYLWASILAYAHINLLEMLWRFNPNEVVRIATDFIYIRKEALYKIKNIPAFFNQVEVKSDPNLYSYYPSCAICSDPEKFLISKSEYTKWIKEFLKTKRSLAKY
ncbi:33916_t:CDS:2 [Racocetra persica]|uniref:33916_t:CDS:1 n=1 Tax=Racocetra persica TaxID=160502 RepID=A0ACA9LKE2_9GLOM|nr:33916_t:CDS:2 [Racocetra persica]